MTVPWEVIVVDNASSDGTAAVALREWPHDASAPLRVLKEPIPGYNHAADLAIANARYSILAHVHDDIWLEKDWLARAVTILANNPEVGACGGHNRARFECSPPKWFTQFKEYYAVGQQSDRTGDITSTRGYLWGAGLCIRTKAWRELKNGGFVSLSTGRTPGRKLIAGEDSEICYVLRLAGWRLWYSDELRLTHFIHSKRLTWRYLRRLSRSYGEASALHDCYLSPFTRCSLVPNPWSKALKQSISNMLGSRLGLLALLIGLEGNSHALQLEREIGRTIELILIRRHYEGNHHRVLNAKWRKPRQELRDVSQAVAL